MNSTSILDMLVSSRRLRKLCATLPLGIAVLVASSGGARAETHAKETRTELVIASGSSHSCALVGDGTVKCWGANSYGQLGNAGISEAATPTLVLSSALTPLSDVVALAAGDSHTCSLGIGGSVLCWGDNSQGQLGHGNYQPSTLPVAVSGIGGNSAPGATAIAAGAVHTCALLANGTVKCWGDNDQYELGDGTAIDRNVPTLVPGLTDVIAITAGADHTCALKNNGQISCWGRNTNGQVGNGTITAQPSPVAVSNLTPVQGVAVAISAGRLHTCALLVSSWTLSGSNINTMLVKCWGYNASGQLGNGATTDSWVPVDTGLTAVQSIAAGGDHSCALLASGKVSCWGDNADGLIGDGTFGGIKPSPSPTIVTTPPPGNSLLSRAVSLGYAHSCAVQGDGTVNCWGNNWRSQMAKGNPGVPGSPVIPVPPTNIYPAPSMVPSLTQIAAGPQVASGSAHSCAVTPGGHVKCWGENSRGQLGRTTTTGVPPLAADAGTVTNAVAVCTGTSHSCALIADGTITCWGDNTYGQGGVSNASSSFINPPSASVLNITTAIGISCGGYHTCATIADGSTMCWGYNAYAQLGNNTTSSSLSNYTPVPVQIHGGGATAGLSRAVMSGGYHNCTMSAQGTAACWGYNGWGNLGDGTNLGDSGTSSRWTPVAITMQGGASVTAKSMDLGGAHSCAVITNGTVQCWGNNPKGELGDGTTTSSYSPINTTAFTVPGAGVNLVTSVSAGQGFTCAKTTHGNLYCWGSNASGQLAATTNLVANAPFSIGQSLVSAIATGGDHTCALYSGGTAKCWGYNASGQLGRNDFVTDYHPLAVVGFP
jgi:alpha-tubulin suppressor-like RCC1 family protein